jgi:hypothetical protein
MKRTRAEWGGSEQLQQVQPGRWERVVLDDDENKEAEVRPQKFM